MGKRLFLKVSDLLSDFSKAKVSPSDSINSVIIEISNKRLGSTAVIDNEKLIGIITDGDLRRMWEKNTNLSELKASDIMSENPKIIHSNCLAAEALSVMEKNNISQLIVMDKETYCGIVHIHDILKEGI